MRGLTWLPAVLLLAACAKVPPVPTDRYYRLNEPTTDRAEGLWTDRIIAIAPFTGDGLQRDRAIAYSRSEDGALQQYRYHFWLDSPTKLMQQHLADYLRACGIGQLVVTDTNVSSDVVIYGRVKRFERFIDGDDYRSRVAVQLRVDNSTAHHPLMVKDYNAEVGNAGPGMEYAIQAFDEAVANVLAKFTADLKLIDEAEAGQQ